MVNPRCERLRLPSVPRAQSHVVPCSFVVAALVMLGAAAYAAPNEDEAPVRLIYRATEGCPDQADFLARIHVRTSRTRSARPGEVAWTFDVIIDAGPPASGSVTVFEPDFPMGTRRMHADTCADVADALALVIALSIDPHAAISPGAPAALLPPAAPSSLPTTELRQSFAPLRTDRPQFENHSWSPSRADVFAGVDLVVAYGVAPSALVSGSPYVGWRANVIGAFDPSFRLAYTGAAADVKVATTGSAAFTWTVGRFDACLAEWSQGPVRLAACARVEAGALKVTASDVPGSETRVRPWLAIGPLVRAEWSFLRIVSLEVEIGLPLRPTNDRFFLRPDTTVYRVPVFAASGGVGLSVHFL
jgi:hypothetical protein